MAEEKQEENPPEEEVADETGGRSKKKLIVIGLGITALVLVGAGGAFFFLSRGAHKGEAASHETIAPEETKSGENAEKPKEGEKKDEKTDAKVNDKQAPEGEVKEEVKEGEKPPSEAKKPAKADDKDEDAEESFGIGKTFNFKPFLINLSNPLESYYLRMEVSVEYSTPKAEKELQRRQAQLRDAIISIVSNKTREFILNPDGKEQLRSEILLRINRYMKNKVEQVFITDLLIE